MNMAGGERGYVNLLKYVKSDDTSDIDKLNAAIQKIWNTLSPQWQKNPPKETVQQKFEELPTEYQKKIVLGSTSADIANAGIENNAVLEDILVALANAIATKMDSGDYEEFKTNILQIIIEIQETLDKKQDIQLSEETLEALDLGDDVQTVEDALIALKVEAGKNIMCEDAQRYYEDQYHAMFNVTYALSCSVSGGGTINPATTDNKTFNLTATITGKATIKNPGETDKQENLTFTTAPTVSGWTLDETASTATSKVYKKTFKFAENGSGDYDFTVDKTFSFPSTSFTYKKWDAVSKTEMEETKSDSTSGSTSVKITRNNFYWNNVNELTAAAFNSGYKDGSKTYYGTFSNGTNSIQSVDQMPVIFASPTSGKKFEMLTKTIIVNTTEISTTLGTYYLYYSGKGNGTKWDVEVK